MKIIKITFIYLKIMLNLLKLEAIKATNKQKHYWKGALNWINLNWELF